MPIVYKATNLVNGKFYVGVTKKTLKQREAEHYSSAKNGVRLVFYNAIRKYGRENFLFEVIGVYLTYDSALAGERFAIKSLKPHYNTAIGGRGPQGVRWSPERRERTLKKMSEAWTDERKKYMSEQNKGKKPSPQCLSSVDKDANCLSVVCVNDGRLFKGIKYAAEFYNISRKGIGEMLSGRQTHVGGYSFIYSDKELTDEQLKVVLNRLEERRIAHKEKLKSGITSLRRKVVLMNTGQIFESGREASRITGVHPSRINCICDKGGKTRSGLVFKYVDN